MAVIAPDTTQVSPHAVTVSQIAISDAAGDAGGAPEWIKVLPAGQFSGRDGRGPFKLTDPAKVLDATSQADMEAGLPLDYDHATDFAAPHGGRAPAAAWMKQFEIRDGAIWAHVEWTDNGREAVASKEYRYISPVFSFDEKTGEILALLRAGLTNNPNLYDTAICARLATMTEQEEKRQALVIKGIAVNLRKKKKSMQAEGEGDDSMVGKLRAAIKEASEEIGLDADVLMRAISKDLGGDLEDPDNDGMADSSPSPALDADEVGEMEAKHEQLFDAHGADGTDDGAMAAFSGWADECKIAAEKAEKDGKTEKAARLRKIEEETRERCSRRGTHARKEIDVMDHLKMAKECERMADEHDAAGRTDDAQLLRAMAKDHRDKHDEEMRTAHSDAAAAAASAKVKPVVDDMNSKIAALIKSNENLQGQLTAVQSRELTNLATQKVDGAISDGYLPPAQREWGINACMKSPADFEAFLKNAVKLPTGIENFETERKVGTVVLTKQEIDMLACTSVSLEQYAAMKARTAKGGGIGYMVAQANA